VRNDLGTSLVLYLDRNGAILDQCQCKAPPFDGAASESRLWSSCSAPRPAVQDSGLMGELCQRTRTAPRVGPQGPSFCASQRGACQPALVLAAAR
jgi:hypothetical protein